MEEAGRTKTDAKGNFSFKLDNAQGPHLVRAIHQEVTYHRMAPPGTTSVEVEVYDVGKKIEGIEVVADIMRVQVEQGQLEVMRTFAVAEHFQAAAHPDERAQPRVLRSRRRPNHRRLRHDRERPTRQLRARPRRRQKDPLRFLFPLRPGTTQFQVAYQLPYTGSANIDPKSIYPLQHFVAILPKTMQFSAAPGANYQPMNDPQQPDANVQVASGAKTGQIAGLQDFRRRHAAIPRRRRRRAQREAARRRPKAVPAAASARPSTLPTRYSKTMDGSCYQWWILSGFAVALTIGGVFVASRQQAANRAARSTGKPVPTEEDDEDYEAAEAPALRDVRASEARVSDARPQPTAARGTTSMLLEGLKEELFQLEVEHKQGRISQQEYEKAKSALDHTLERALKREATKQV